MGKKFFSVIVAFVATNLLVFGLYRWSEHDNARQGSFRRFIDMHPWKTFKSVYLRYNSYYIAGTSRQNLILGNSTAPLAYTTLSPVLDTNTLLITGRIWDKTKFTGPRLYVKDSLRVVYDGSVRKIIHIDPISNLATSAEASSLRFTNLIPLNSGSLFMKLFDDSSQQMILVKERSGKRLGEYVFKKQVDGIFCVDGQLDIVGKEQQLVYCYYYRNQILVLDSNLSLLHSFNTIDTNTTAKIKISPIKSQDVVTLAEPPQNVNKRIAGDGDKLYIIGGQQASNEESDLFANNSVVDIYNIGSGKYVKSFYLPDLFESKVKAFKVAGKNLWALYERHLVIFYLC